MVSAKVTVAKIEGQVRVIVALPADLSALPVQEQDRAINEAMWQGAVAAQGFLDRERTTGSARAVTTELRVA